VLRRRLAAAAAVIKCWSVHNRGVRGLWPELLLSVVQDMSIGAWGQAVVALIAAGLQTQIECLGCSNWRAIVFARSIRRGIASTSA